MRPAAGGPGEHGAARTALLVGTATVLAALLVLLFWFQPQTLLFDRVVDEEIPSERQEAEVGATSPMEVLASPDPPSPRQAPPTTPQTPAPTEDTSAEPVLLLTGQWTSRSRYTVEGTGTVLALPDGGRILRLEDFASTNGPDLFVYLTAAGASAGDGELGADFVDLGVLKGNRGNQNYEIPPEVDLERYQTVVIWCRRFTVAFGAADLR